MIYHRPSAIATKLIMKKRKLTKEQIEKRKHFLKVTKNVVFYISLALNAIVLIALCVSGCSSSKANNVRPSNNDDHIALLDKPHLEKNEKINDFDIFDNTSTICYDLTTLNVKTNDYITTGEYHYFSTIDNIILFGGDGIVWSDVNEIYVSFNVFQGGVDGNSIQISAQHRNSDNSSYRVAGRYWGYSNGAWQTQNLQSNSGYDTLTGFYIAFNYAQLNENQFGLIGLLENLFDTIEYRDYSLDLSWRIWEKFSVISGNSARFEYIAQNIIFAVNGRFYDSIRARYVYSDGDNGYYYPDTDTYASKSGAFLYSIEYYNHTNNESLSVFLPKYRQLGKDNVALTYIVYNDYKLVDANYLNIRLFAINLVQGNTNVVDVFQYLSSTTNSSEGDFGNVFTLFGNAFDGLTNLLAINLLPGISLGVLLFLPLVGIIVFALIRIIKK